MSFLALLLCGLILAGIYCAAEWRRTQLGREARRREADSAQRTAQAEVWPPAPARSPADAPQDGPVVVVTFAASLPAEMARSQLDAAGIFCLLTGEIITRSDFPLGLNPGGNGMIRLMVRPEDSEAARAVLGGQASNSGETGTL